MAQLLGNVAVGTTVYLNENGSPKPYLVVNQGIPQNSPLYDSSCNGTWLLKKLADTIDLGKFWDNGNSNELPGAQIFDDLQENVLTRYDEIIQNQILSVKIPYCIGNSSSTVESGNNGLSCKIFLLGAYEVGLTTDFISYIPVDGAALSYFQNTSEVDSKRIYYESVGSSNAIQWWLRSQKTNSSNNVYCIKTSGGSSYVSANNNVTAIRPALILPTSLYVWNDGTISTVAGPNTTFSQLPSQAMTDQQIPISWNPIDSADSYILQRNADNGGWTQVYSGTATSFTDTAGSWSTVQYQVQGVFSGTGGPWTQSASIPVISASALVISGADSDLGTITSDIPYTVSSDTGNDITLTRTVNGVQVASLTVQSGFAYNIPVVDLPTGTGTIVISASVTASSGTVTATRTWTYAKTSMTFSNSAGIGQLSQNGQNIWPLTVPDAIKTPAYMGGNLGTALNQLSRAVLYNQNQIAKYAEVNINLANVSVGDEVNLPYNGVMVPHIVVQIGNPNAEIYDASCDGVWLLRKNIVENGQWNSSNVNTLNGSTIMATMQGYVANYDSTVQSSIQTVKIPYCVGNSSTTVNTLTDGLQCQVFPLGAYELGVTTNDYAYYPVDGSVLSYFQSISPNADPKRISQLNGIATAWWTRAPYTSNNNECFKVGVSGNLSGSAPNQQSGIRPCFIMPTTFNSTYLVDEAGNIGTEQEYISAGSYEDILGNTIPVSKIETGSYVGTGTYGDANPNTLTFEFNPKLLYVQDIFSQSGAYVNANVSTDVIFTGTGWVFPNGPRPDTSSPALICVTQFGNTVSWYSPSHYNQLNIEGHTYRYVSIG